MKKINIEQASNERLLELYYYWHIKYDDLDFTPHTSAYVYHVEKMFDYIENECLKRLGGHIK